MSDLFSIFSAAASADASWHPSCDELEELCRLAEDAYPDFGDHREVLVRALAEKGAPPTEADGLAELYLAACCAAGSEKALAVFASSYLSAAVQALSHMYLPGDLAADVVQKTSEKLLVPGAGGAVKVVTYAGRGRLRGLIKVVAVRTALSALRKYGKEVQLPEAGPDIFEGPSESDAELAFVKEQYRAEFKVAFERAVDALSERERNLLRLHLLRGVTLAALADIYGVHRATVTRWLAAARAKLLKTTRARLGQQLELGRAEIDSVMNWIGSRLEASVSRVLRTRRSADDA